MTSSRWRTRKVDLTDLARVIRLGVTSREVVRQLTKLGCTWVRQAGSHATYVSPCGKCFTTVAMHAGVDILRGTLHGIKKDMTPCPGADWLTRKKK